MENLSDLRVIEALLKRHGFHFSKALGQNFLVDETVCPRMAALCGADRDTCVLEIGPGIGVLTAELAKTAKKVVSIELDDRLLPLLNETLADYDNVEIVSGDVLKLDLPALFDEKFGASRVVVCANLPYYITTPILMRLLESELPVDAITVMVQKEVADRLCARPGEKNAGAITVCVDYYAHAEVLFGVPKGAFLPSPKVDSAVIRLTRREKPAVETNDVKAFFRLVKAAFAQRRKTAVNSISATLSVPKAQVAKALTDCGLSETVRAEALTSEDFAALYRALGGAP